MKFAKINLDEMNGASKEDMVREIISKIVSEVIIEEVIDNTKTDFVVKEMAFNEDMMKLADNYDFSPIDIINNATGTVFALYCDKEKDNNPNFDAKRHLNLFVEAGRIVNESMDNELVGQSHEEKILTLLNAIILLTKEKKSKSKKVKCNCSRCRAKAETESNKEPNNTTKQETQDKIFSILDDLFDLVK